MKTLKGKATSAIIFNTDTKDHSIDNYALAQLQNLCDNPAFSGCKIRVMPDVHPGTYFLVSIPPLPYWVGRNDEHTPQGQKRR